jgi:hypothetical protein
LFKRHEKRGERQKPAKTIVCPVCRGECVLHMTPAEASHWNERDAAKRDDRVDSVVRPCWACAGEGKIPVENGESGIGHFER